MKSGFEAIVRLAVLLIGALALAGCIDRFPDHNYKMTIHAKGQEFSSVRRVETSEDVFGVNRSLEGEAVIIDHPDGKTYYALLTRPENFDYSIFVMGYALAPHLPKPKPRTEVQEAIDEYWEENGPQDSFGDAAKALQYMVKMEGAYELPRMLPPRRNREPKTAWPMFVTFADPTNARTAREVDPDKIGIERITIEITDEKVTTGIEDTLNWKDYYGREGSPRDVQWGDGGIHLTRTDFVMR